MLKFSYPPLPSTGELYIRLVRVHAGTFDDDVRITMRPEIFAERTTSLSDSARNRPIYEAISYAWDADDLKPARITVAYDRETANVSSTSMSSHPAMGGRDGWLSLGSNAVSALRHFRYPDRPRDLWVDTMCIDQEDSVDKGQQVAMMGEIYARAKAVLIWLGESAQNSDLAMTCIAHVGSQTRFEKSTRFISATKDCRDVSLLDRNIPLPLSRDEMCAIYHLLSRRWFERLWIRQEITLADQKTATIACGQKKVLWKVKFHTFHKSCTDT